MNGERTARRRVDSLVWLIVGAVAGALAGVGAAYLTVAVTHVIAPDNVLAGLGMGFGGVIAGMLAAYALVARADAW